MLFAVIHCTMRPQTPPVASTISNHGKKAMDDKEYTSELAQDFQKHMAAIIDTVQAGIWQKGVFDLLNYSTDYGFGQKRGLQSLILKTGHKSAYVRLHWNTVMGNEPEAKQSVTNAVQNAINELS